mgnify:CR=1 FL=1
MTSFLVELADIGQIRHVIEALVDDPEKREQMGGAVIRMARKSPSQDRARRILEWLE